MVGQYTLYSKSGCKYCAFAKNDFLAMQKNGIDVQYLEVSLDSPEIERDFKSKHPNLTTLPQVFAPNGGHIGGYEDLTEHFKAIVDLSDWI